jgi:hypothetical protein
MRALALSLVVLASLAAGCNGQAGLGEACAAPGIPAPAFQGCAAGLVCSPNRSAPAGSGQTAHWVTDTCREVCSSNLDCTTPHTTCRSVSGAEYQMACLPD